MLRKTTKKRSTNKKPRRTKKVNALRTNTWELVPFVVAVIIAIIVVAQSMESAQRERIKNGSSLKLMEGGTPTHMAAEDCELVGAPLRELKSSERALQRTMQSLDEAETLYQWECSTQANDPECMNAKRSLRRENRLVKQKIQETQLMRIQACL